MKKILILTLCAVALILSFSVSAFADHTPTELRLTAEEASENAGAEKDAGNVATEIYSLVIDNSDRIFSVLAFLSSLLLAFLYKRGMIPMINTGLSAIKKSADSFGSAASESLLRTEETVSLLTDKVASYANTAESVAQSIDAIFEKLDVLENEKNEMKVFSSVMISQIDMLYEIFMNSALPQYSKDAIGEKMARMKKSLQCGEENG